MFPVVETNKLMKSVSASRPIVAQGKSVSTMREWCVGCCNRKVFSSEARVKAEVFCLPRAS